MKINNKKILFLLVFIMFIVFIGVDGVFAASCAIQDNICEESGPLKVIRLIQKVINLIQIAVPLVLVIMVMFNCVSAVISDSDNIFKVLKKSINKLIAAAIIFLVPAIVNMVIGFIGQDKYNATDCWLNAQDDAKITALEEQEAECESK